MDPSSHTCMGIAMGLLVANISTNIGIEVDATSLIALSAIAHNFPDIDVVLKLKNNETYINFHRSVTHSVLFAILWIILLTLVGYIIGPNNIVLTLIVSFLGIFFHIFTDLLNGYGVQFLWPFNKKWIAFGITYTVDIFLIIMHVVTFILIFKFNTNILISIICLYIILTIYILFEFILHYNLKKSLIKKYGKYKRLILQSKSTPFKWKYVYETTNKYFYMGEIVHNTIIQLRYEKRREIIDKDLEKIIHQNKSVNTFINFTPIYNYHVKHKEKGVLEIKFYDLRYLMVRNGTHMYQLNCLVKVNNNEVIDSYIGFIINENIIEKKFKSFKNKE